VFLSPKGSPFTRKKMMLERAEGTPAWRPQPMLFFYRGQSCFGSSSLTFVRLPTSQLTATAKQNQENNPSF